MPHARHAARLSRRRASSALVFFQDIGWRRKIALLWQIAVRLCTGTRLGGGDVHFHRGGRRRCCARRLARALTLLIFQPTTTTSLASLRQARAIGSVRAQCFCNAHVRLFGLFLSLPSLHLMSRNKGGGEVVCTAGVRRRSNCSNESRWGIILLVCCAMRCGCRDVSLHVAELQCLRGAGRPRFHVPISWQERRGRLDRPLPCGQQVSPTTKKTSKQGRQ